MTSVLAIIPAKGTSSRVPGKNLRLLGGIPLFLWTVRAALGVMPKRAVVVSTDDDEIARLAAAEGAGVIRRPPELCRDPAQAPDVAIHALDYYKWATGNQPDTVCMLLPTSPFRTTAHIEAALAVHHDSAGGNVVSVTDASEHLKHKLCYGNEHSITAGPPLRDPGPFISHHPPSHVERRYLLNGAIWIATPGALRTHGHVSAIHALPYVMDEESGLDIDSELDFAVAEVIAARQLARRTMTLNRIGELLMEGASRGPKNRWPEKKPEVAP